jgi:hypothetical protein
MNVSLVLDFGVLLVSFGALLASFGARLVNVGARLVNFGVVFMNFGALVKDFGALLMNALLTLCWPPHQRRPQVHQRPSKLQQSPLVCTFAPCVPTPRDGRGAHPGNQVARVGYSQRQSLLLSPMVGALSVDDGAVFMDYGALLMDFGLPSPPPPPARNLRRARRGAFQITGISRQSPA